MIEYLQSLVATFREANAHNAEPERAANEIRIAAFARAVATVEPFL